MRAVIGFLGFNGLALVLGFAVLYAAGLVRLRPWDLFHAAGAALLAGLGAIALVALVGLIAGVGIDLAPLVLLAVLAVGTLALVGRRRSEVPPAVESAVSWRAALIPGLVVLFIAVQAISSLDVPVAWDAAHIWSLKAIALSDWAKLQGALFTDAGVFGMAHLDYPLGWPVLGSLSLRAAADATQGVLLAQLWVILGATVLAVPWMVRAGRWTALAFAPMLLALFSAPTAGLLRGDADVPMACFVCAGAVALARTLESRRPGYAVLAALWLGTAVNIKNEGLAFSAGVLVVALVAAVASRRRASIVCVGLTGVAVAALAAPWKLWTAAHGPFASDVAPLSDALDLGYLADKAWQLDLGAQTMLGRLAEPSAYWLVPALLALTVGALVARRAAPLAAIYLGALVLSVLAVLWVYWTSQLADIVGHIARTTLRTTTGPLFIAAAGLAHLLPRLLAEVRVEEVVASPAEAETAAAQPALSPR